MKYNDYLKTDYWKAVSGAVKAKAGFKCQVCNSPHDLNAHHRSYDHRGNELDHLDDLICLCRRCHGIFHGRLEPEPVAIRKPQSNGPSESHETMRQIREKWVYDHDADMPPGSGLIVLDRKLVNKLRTKAGGHTSATLACLGLYSPLRGGWSKRLEGQTVSRQVYRKALEGRQVYA